MRTIKFPPQGLGFDYCIDPRTRNVSSGPKKKNHRHTATQGQMLLPRTDSITFIKSKKVGGAHFWRIITQLDGRGMDSNIPCLKI